jgi:transcriptional regulator with XRE-family HTH domain
MVEKEARLSQARLFECLGRVISARRKRLAMSQEKLADQSDVDRAFISKVEGGKRNPSFGVVAKIAHGLRMHYARLVQNCEQCVHDEDKSA